MVVVFPLSMEHYDNRLPRVQIKNDSINLLSLMDQYE